MSYQNTSPAVSTNEIPDGDIVVTEQERMRLLMAEMLVRCLEHHLITDETFLKHAEALDVPGGPPSITKPPPTGLLPR